MTDRRSILRLRGELLRAVRAFFYSRDFIEVQTQVRVSTPALETHIDAEPSGKRYLRTSPEFCMKRLLTEGHARIFEVGPCFRRGERGRFHHPEYTMLEWYRAGADYNGMLEETRDLLNCVAAAVHGGTEIEFDSHGIDFAVPWEVITVREAFENSAGWDPVAQFDPDRFDLDLVARVEPSLPADRPVILKDYPAPRAALARLKEGDPAVAERWELYVAGVELANAFSELVDPVEQRRRFEECAKVRRAAGKAVYSIDEAFIEALESGMPPCGGVALGIDRLLMLLTGASRIDEVLAFV